MSEIDQAWSALREHFEAIGPRQLRDLFAEDPDRQPRLTFDACGLRADFSKQRIVADTLDLFARLARASGLEERRRAMFDGEVVNETEGRAVLHTALRSGTHPDVLQVLEQMRAFTEQVRGGEWLGFTGKRIRDIVNIGIGGSDRGPEMAATALDAMRMDGLRGHYVSNLDAAHIEGVLRDLDPETTLFVIASKTFSTQETLLNATSARSWLVEALGDEAAVARHFVAVSTAEARVRAFGIDPKNMFRFWDWVGGRYSLWSAIGLSVALLVGMDAFEAMLAGARAMDRHFLSAPLDRNLPVLMGMLGVWYTSMFEAETQAIVVYDYALRGLPPHLEQLEMESTGKRVRRDGSPVVRPTCPILFGGLGNNGQHAYFQLLHQGTHLVPADFIVAMESQSSLPGHQQAVLSNAFGQTEALMNGRTLEEADGDPHRVMPGNQPTTTLLYRRLTPEVLGALVALYEHKVFVQSVVWDINAFDQWGVELGKKLAGQILEDLEDDGEPRGHDASTAALIQAVAGPTRAVPRP